MNRSLLILNKHHEPETIMGARVTQGKGGNYRWHLKEVKSHPLRIASRELRNTLLQLDRLDLERRYQGDTLRLMPSSNGTGGGLWRQ